MKSIVVVGAGQAGVGVAEALRTAGSTAAITVVGDEDELPYERPPLSKAVLVGKSGRDDIRLHTAEWYDTHAVISAEGRPRDWHRTGLTHRPTG